MSSSKVDTTDLAKGAAPKQDINLEEKNKCDRIWVRSTPEALI